MRLLPLLAVAAMLLAGCSSAPDAPEGSQSVTTVTDPSAPINGSDQSFHLHDYWGGEDRVLVMDQEADLGFLLNGGYFGAYKFYPDEEAVVPQGTAAVEITFSWTDNAPGYYGDIELWVKTQADAQPEKFAVLESGRPVTFDTILEDADLPHQTLSAWEFMLHILSPDGQPTNPATGQLRSFNMNVQAKAEAIRGLELPLFPPHPDRWDNQTELPLIDDASGGTLMWLQQPPNCGFCSGGLFIVSPDTGRLVPTDAAAVEVTMTYTKQTPTGVKLLYHGADTREWSDAPVDSDDSRRRVHVIPVEANGDGPYASQSLWEFYFRFEGGTGEMGPYSGEWQLEARVLKDMPM